MAPTLVRPPLLSKGEFEDVSDLVEPALCSKWPLTSGVAGGKGVSPFICPCPPCWGCWGCCCCCWWWSFWPPWPPGPWGLTMRSPPPDWIWDSDNTKGGWWWPICVWVRVCLRLDVQIKIGDYLRGNDIGSGSVTGYPLWSSGNLRQHTELHYNCWAKIKTNWTRTNVIIEPLITYLTQDVIHKYI